MRATLILSSAGLLGSRVLIEPSPNDNATPSPILEARYRSNPATLDGAY